MLKLRVGVARAERLSVLVLRFERLRAIRFREISSEKRFAQVDIYTIVLIQVFINPILHRSVEGIFIPPPAERSRQLDRFHKDGLPGHRCTQRVRDILRESRSYRWPE